MALNQVSPGNKLPDLFNVIIEIPAESDPIKYEVDKETSTVFVDRFLTVAMYYPCNYGYVPQTLSGDGDPVDVLVITPYPLLPGVGVVFERAEGQKCQRCWQILPDVGTHRHPGTCARCNAALG